jgi:ATP citrate (pro-S)-lyase
LGLIKVNADFPAVKSWVEERMGKDQKIGRATGKLRNFIIEPFISHDEVRFSILLKIIFLSLPLA